LSANNHQPTQETIMYPTQSRTIQTERFASTTFALLTAIAFLLAAPVGTRAATFVVNSTADTSDANPGDGMCDDGEGNCTLRAAIEEANALANDNGVPDQIHFNIEGEGPHTIAPQSPLPDITDPVIIDGYTQPGARENTLMTGTDAVLLIELDGSDAGFTHGLTIDTSNCVIQGLVINRFEDSGIVITGGDDNVILQNGGNSDNVIRGNYVGTDPTGTIGRGNGDEGVLVRGPNNLIGGPDPGSRNVISDNVNDGVDIESDGNTVENNYIGTDATGTAALGNGNDGVEIDGSNNMILNNLISANGDEGIQGGNAANGNLIEGNFIGTDASGTSALGNESDGIDIEGSNNMILNNLISANGDEGIDIDDVNATGNVIQGNRIGTDITGALPLGNASDGVEIKGFGNLVGGMEEGEENLIAFNGGAGVTVAGGGNTAVGNAILGNSIHSNNGLGIDLGRDGVTPNDDGDADIGPNNLQNFPVLTSALVGNSITIAGTLNSVANTMFRIELFANRECDPSGHGEGEVFLGHTDVATDGTGNAAFEVTFDTDAAEAGDFITATATDPDGNTSEFSACLLVESGELQPPSITCPANIVVANTVSQCGRSVSFVVSATGTPTPTVVCMINSTVISSPHFFPVGMTTVECTATNSEGEDSCSFTVTVNDTQPPTVSCPPNQTVIVSEGQSSAVVTYPNPVVADNCPGVGVVCMPPSGSEFALGNTTVTCTATDAAGNTAACSFTVTVSSQLDCTSISDLVELVERLDLNRGLKRSLRAKLRSAQRSLDRGNTDTSIRKLRAFIQQVEALSRGGLAPASRRLDSEEAATLIDCALSVIAAIREADGSLPYFNHRPGY
jgi:CSLREA domain-containing protein